MPGQFGNKGGGRKTKREEKEAAIEEITELALLKLARSKVRQHLDKNLNFKQTKEMALPIVVKGMSQKLANDPENPFIIQIAKAVANKNGINPSPKQDSREPSTI